MAILGLDLDWHIDVLTTTIPGTTLLFILFAMLLLLQQNNDDDKKQIVRNSRYSNNNKKTIKIRFTRVSQFVQNIGFTYVELIVENGNCV